MNLMSGLSIHAFLKMTTKHNSIKKKADTTAKAVAVPTVGAIQ